MPRDFSAPMPTSANWLVTLPDLSVTWRVLKDVTPYKQDIVASAGRLRTVTIASTVTIPSTEVTPTRTVLIVDRELGFVFWLSQALDEAGYRAFPAKSIPDANNLLLELNIEI